MHIPHLIHLSGLMTCGLRTKPLIASAGQFLAHKWQPMQFRIDRVGQQRLALFGTAGLVSDVFQIFIIEVVQCRQNRVGGGLS